MSGKHEMQSREESKQASNKPGRNMRRSQHSLVGAAPAGGRRSRVGHRRLERKGKFKRREEGRRKKGTCQHLEAGQLDWVEMKTGLLWKRPRGAAACAAGGG